jgi:hypothetical protein
MSDTGRLLPVASASGLSVFFCLSAGIPSASIHGKCLDFWRNRGYIINSYSFPPEIILLLNF